MPLIRKKHFKLAQERGASQVQEYSQMWGLEGEIRTGDAMNKRW